MVIVVGESLASLEIADVRQQQILLKTFFEVTNENFQGR
jgi:hypothetical protein